MSTMCLRTTHVRERHWHLSPKTVLTRMASKPLGPISLSALFDQTWADMLSRYSNTVLINDEDKLSALAGIAELMNHQHNYEVSFRLW